MWRRKSDISLLVNLDHRLEEVSLMDIEEVIVSDYESAYVWEQLSRTRTVHNGAAQQLVTRFLTSWSGNSITVNVLERIRSRGKCFLCSGNVPYLSGRPCNKEVAVLEESVFARCNDINKDDDDDDNNSSSSSSIVSSNGNSGDDDDDDNTGSRLLPYGAILNRYN